MFVKRFHERKTGKIAWDPFCDDPQNRIMELCGGRGRGEELLFFSGQFFPIQFRRSADGGFPSLRVMTFVK